MKGKAFMDNVFGLRAWRRQRSGTGTGTGTGTSSGSDVGGLGGGSRSARSEALSRRDWLRGRWHPPAPPGAARVIPSACLAHQRVLCSSCAERCPLAGALRIVAGKPVVDAARCDGCGECALACPAPGRALVVG